MWFLECDGDVLGRKRIWLRPGRSYLFGRTKAAEASNAYQHNYVISNKSVSRKHLIISVAKIPAGNATRVHERSKCTIQDDSKIGTYLDGEKIVKNSQVLTKKEHKVQLGSFSQTFKISWRPTVFTFSFTSKQQERAGSDIFEPYRPLLEPLDMKITNEFLVNETTHVVSGKRNHQRGLLALLNARYLVTDPFLDAVVRASEISGQTATDPDSPQSLLEMDFDANWPNAMEYVPSAGKEPNPSPVSMFAPNTDRVHVFESLSFVFADDSQHANLQSVVNNGGAKCYKFPMKRNETPVHEFVDYVRKIAGEKGLSGSSGVSEEIGVIFVRFPVQKDSDTWAINFIREVDRALGQRSIEQNEFLGAILLNDASSLKRPLEEEESMGTDMPSTAVSTRTPALPSTQLKLPPSSEILSEQSQPAAPKSRARRTLAQSRFKGWDEMDDEPIQPKKHTEPMVNNKSERDTRQNPRNSDSQGLFVNDAVPFLDSKSTSNAKKRAHPLSDDEDDAVNHQEQMMDALLPAKAALKRRRLEDERLRVPNGAPSITSRSPSVDPDNNTSKPRDKRLKTPKQEVDVRAVARSHATEMDKRRRGKTSHSDSNAPIKGVQEDEEENNYDDIDPTVAYNLAAIAEMEITPRNDVPTNASQRREAAHSERWNNRWNGRKDFKGFRRQRARDDENGTDGVNLRGHRKVVVALEPAKKKDYGIGEHYWVTKEANGGDDEDSDNDEEALRPRSRAKSKGQSQAQTQTEGRAQRSISGRGAPIMIDDDDDDSDDAIHESPVRPSRSTQVSTTVSSQVKNGKRPATMKPAAKAPPAKRQKQSRLFEAKEDDGDEEDDDLKFKSRRRK